MTKVHQRFSPWQRRIAVSLPLLLMLAIFGLSSISYDLSAPEQSPLGGIPPTLQNFLHIPLYGLLALLWFGALAALGADGRLRLLLAGLISFSYGVLDELHQLTVPGRFGSLSDVLFNTIGIGLALLVCAWFQRRFWRQFPRIES